MALASYVAFFYKKGTIRYIQISHTVHPNVFMNKLYFRRVNVLLTIYEFNIFSIEANSISEKVKFSVDFTLSMTCNGSLTPTNTDVIR